MYNEMSEIYDQLMAQDVNYTLWSDYIEKIFNKNAISAVKTVLDLGCGTGNITIPLAKKGFFLTGLDLSEEMLAIADSKAFEAGENIQWIKGDMTNSTEGKYDGIISCCDCVNYIIEDKDLEAAFRSAYHALKDNGVFTFDMNTHYKLSTLYSEPVFTYVSDQVCYIWENTFDDEENVIEYYINFFVEKEDGLYKRFEEIHYQRAYRQEEIIALLGKAGFTKIDVWSFQTFDPVKEDDERIQFCCRR